MLGMTLLNFIKKHILYLGIVFVFVAISLYIAPFHEFWADEIQAYLISRDANWLEIFIDTPQREGQPVLWHILLKCCIYLFGENINISYISIAIMTMTVIVIVFKYNIPLIYKILIPFGYYFIYQYNIVSRNYCLAYLALSLVGMLYNDRHKKIWRYTLSLAFLAETTSFYISVSATLAIYYLLEIYLYQKTQYKNYICPLLFLIMVGITILWQILPLNYTSYNLRYLYPPVPFILQAFFTGENIYLNWIFYTLGSIFLLYFLLNKSKIETYTYHFVLCNLLFFLCMYITLPTIHHQGILYGFFLFSYYLFFPIKKAQNHLFFISILILQVYWSFCSIKYDIKNTIVPYKKVVHILNNKFKDTNIKIIGYETLPVQALLPQYNTRKTSYYIWNDNELNQEKDILSSANIIVIDSVSKKRYDADRILDTDKYRVTHFRGALPNKDGLGFGQNYYLYEKIK